MPPTDDIELLYHDDAILLINKPSGLLSVPGRGPDKQDCASARVQRHFEDALVVHRLDMATSGLMLLARGLEIQRLLSQAFAERLIHKRYVAVVEGYPQAPGPGWHVIDMALMTDWPNRPRQMVSLSGRPSKTRWRILSRESAPWGKHRTRLELEPVTGRSHQLRVHLQAIGHPIVGDALYAPAEVQAGASRLLLHAHELGLVHPGTGEFMRWTSPVPF